MITSLTKGMEALLFDSILSMAHVIHAAGNIGTNRRPNCKVTKSWSGSDQIEDAYKKACGLIHYFLI
jgi:hypothetical protein